MECGAIRSKSGSCGCLHGPAMTATTGARRGRSGTSRLRLYTRAALFAVVAAFAISVLGSTGADTVSGRLGGDFPAFYAAGSIAADGDWADLYDPDRQLAEQARLFPESDDSFLYFAYPPHAAAVYRPLAAMDYRVAYVLHSVLMAGAAIAAVSLIRPMVPLVRSHFELAASLALLFNPVLRAVTGGQNTALTMLGVAGVWRLLHDDEDVGAGLVIALLLYKPQVAVPLAGVLVLGRRWRAVGATGAGGLVIWGFGAMLMGTGWVSTWWTEVRAFAELDADVNGHNAISWLGVAEHLAGAGTTTAYALAAPLVVATVGAVSFVWLSGRFDLATRFAVTAAGILLMSPHAMFYDGGLLVITAAVALDRIGARAVPVVAAVWAGSWLQMGAGALDFAPLFVLMLGGLGVLAAQWKSSSSEAPAGA